MIKPVDAIPRMYYNTYKPSDIRRKEKELKEIQEYQKSTGHQIDIRV